MEKLAADSGCRIEGPEIWLAVEMVRARSSAAPVVLAVELPTRAATGADVAIPMRARASLIVAALMPDMDANGRVGVGGTICVRMNRQIQDAGTY